MKDEQIQAELTKHANTVNTLINNQKILVEKSRNLEKEVADLKKTLIEKNVKEEKTHVEKVVEEAIKAAEERAKVSTPVSPTTATPAPEQKKEGE